MQALGKYPLFGYSHEGECGALLSKQGRSLAVLHGGKPAETLWHQLCSIQEGEKKKITESKRSTLSEVSPHILPFYLSFVPSFLSFYHSFSLHAQNNIKMGQ